MSAELYTGQPLPDARKMCPYLGSLSIEEAGKAINEMAELMSLGMEALAETQAAKPEGAKVGNTDEKPVVVAEVVAANSEPAAESPAVEREVVVESVAEIAPVILTLPEPETEKPSPLTELFTVPDLEPLPVSLIPAEVERQQTALAPVAEQDISVYPTIPVPELERSASLAILPPAELAAARPLIESDTLAAAESAEVSELLEPAISFSTEQESAAVEVQEATWSTWEAEMQQASPEAVFDGFVDALQEAAVEEAMTFWTEDIKSEGDPVADKNKTAPVVTEVSVRLTESTVEQKEVALPIVQNITESLQNIKRLQAKVTSPREIVAAVEEMRDQIVQLFEAIGVEYDDQKVEYFMRAMLDPNFVVRTQTLLTPEELARMGTREVKLAEQFAPFLSQTSDLDEPSASHRMGRLVVFITHPSLALELWPKADELTSVPS